MRTVLICHHDEALNHKLMPRWMTSFSDLAGILLIKEDRITLKQRLNRELKRVGPIRILDVIAFRLFYKLKLASQDQNWEEQFLREHQADYPELAPDIPILETNNPNGKAAKNFLKNAKLI